MGVWCETTVKTLWTTEENCCFLSSVMLGVSHRNAASQESVKRKIFRKRRLFVIPRGNALIDLIFHFSALVCIHNWEVNYVSETQPGQVQECSLNSNTPGGHASRAREWGRLGQQEAWGQTHILDMSSCCPHPAHCYTRTKRSLLPGFLVTQRNQKPEVLWRHILIFRFCQTVQTCLNIMKAKQNMCGTRQRPPASSWSLLVRWWKYSLIQPDSNFTIY